MDPMTMMMAGSLALGGVKALEDQQRAKRQRKVDSAKALWSPWTGMAPGQTPDPSIISPLMQAGMTGAMMGQQMGLSGKGGEGGVKLTDIPADQMALSPDGDALMSPAARRQPKTNFEDMQSWLAMQKLIGGL